MKEQDIKTKIERLIRSKSFELNLKGTLYKKYRFESVSVLNLNSGDFSSGNYQFEGIAQIGIPNKVDDLFYHCYSISGVAMINDESILIVEPINVYKK